MRTNRGLLKYLKKDRDVIRSLFFMVSGVEWFSYSWCETGYTATDCVR